MKNKRKNILNPNSNFTFFNLVDKAKYKFKKDSINYLYESYCKHLKLEYSNNYVYNYSLNMRKYFLSFYDEKDSCNQITLTSLQKIKEKILSSNLSPNSINILFSYIKKFLSFLVREEAINNKQFFKYDYIFSNVRAGVTNKYRNYLRANEIKILFDYMQNNLPFNLYILFSCLFYGALRIGELLALTFNDVDFNLNSISINKSLNQQNKVGGVKTYSSNGTIYLPKRIIEGIIQIKKEENASDNNRIFFPQKTYSRVHLSHILNKCVSSCNIHNISLHGLRHTMASYMFEKGINIVDISKHLRHANPGITLAVYTHKISLDNFEIINNLDIEK